MTNAPKPFEVHESGAYLHGTKADLEIGDVLEPGRQSNYDTGRTMNHVYLTETIDAAVWGAELAAGDGRARIYIVEPTGPLEDDPNVTDKRFPGNPTQSYRTRHPLRVVGEVDSWEGHDPEVLKGMLDHLALLREQGLDVIED
jgi:rifampin ADP-ribosylating transferase